MYFLERLNTTCTVYFYKYEAVYRLYPNHLLPLRVWFVPECARSSIAKTRILISLVSSEIVTSTLVLVGGLTSS